MEIIKTELLKLNGSVITIGAFDGIHLGHQKLINKTKERAEQLNVPSVVYTFNPIPRVYFQSVTPIMSIEEKLDFLKTYNIDYVIVANFNNVYVNRGVIDFINEIEMLNPKELWVGRDFRFGKSKEGSISDLRKNFTVHVLPPVYCTKGSVISSTRIRDSIKKNHNNHAVSLLGH